MTCAKKAQLGTLAFVLCCLLQLPAKAQALRTVVFSDAPAPNIPSGVSFDFLSTPRLNNLGNTAFFGRLTGTGVDSTNDRVILSEGGGNGLEIIVREGESAPGTPSGVNFSGSPNNGPQFNNGGEIAFRDVLRGTGVDDTNNVGIFSGGGGNGLQLIARDGDNVPGMPIGITFSLLGEPILNGAGEIAFAGSFDGAGDNDRGIFRRGGGNGLELVVREGDAAGMPIGANLSGFNSFSLSLNGAGEIAFIGFLTGPGINFDNNIGIFSESGGNGLKLIARTGDNAPGTQNGVYFNTFTTPVLNGAGQIAFRSSLAGVGVDDSDGGINNNTGIFSEGGGNGLQLIARAGDNAPGTPIGVNFTSFSNDVLNDAGEMAFCGGLRGPGVDDSNDDGIFSEGGGNGLQLIARSGDNAPGTPSGVVFNSFSSPVLNGGGQIAFTCRLTGTGVDFSNDRGIWAQDLSGSLTLIAREGDLLDVNSDPSIDDIRTISGLGFSDGFNDRGQLVFLATFTDGTIGVFVSNAVASVILGDCNLDGVVDFSDIPAFIAILQSGTFLEQADCNQDGVVDFSDILAFITILSGR